MLALRSSWLPAPAFAFLIGLFACGGGSKDGTGTTHVTPPSAPSIASFDALPNAIMTGDSASLSWSVTGATGLSIDHEVGGVTGQSHITVSPTTTTTYTLTATNDGGSSTKQTTVTVGSTPVAPVIVTQPKNASVVTGQTATFTVEAYGTGPLTYVWRKGGQAITGAASTASYTTPATVDADNGAKFSVVVSNAVDNVTSGDAILTVKAPGSVAGVLPAGMPAHMAVGLMEDPGETWMKDSGVTWDARYHYFTKGWVNNWGWSAYDGSWGLAFMQECDQQGFLPTIQYYQINGESNYDESAFYATTKNATIMKSYFGDFKILMQRAKDFGKPVLVMMEADGFAYMEIQSGDDPNAYSAIADSGMTELQGLPNTAAGWGLAFLQIRKAVGANNVILGMHVSDWATQMDIAYYSADIPLEPEVQKAYAFLSKLGLVENITGETYDVLVGDPLDRDSGYYEVVKGLGQDRWWDASDDAPINSKSFNRYAEWLRIWNQTAQKRWVLWQIPLGNSNHLNVANNDGPRQGYKDNRPEYFFASGTADHLQKFADVGVIALLFGRGEGTQSTYTNDVYTDGQLFMKSRAGALLNAGKQPPLAP
jgi:hypothetical protein